MHGVCGSTHSANLAVLPLCVECTWQLYLSVYLCVPTVVWLALCVECEHKKYLCVRVCV